MTPQRLFDIEVPAGRTSMARSPLPDGGRVTAPHAAKLCGVGMMFGLAPTSKPRPQPKSGGA